MLIPYFDTWKLALLSRDADLWPVTHCFWTISSEMKSRLKSCHACTSLWGTELVIEFRLESHEILTNAETDWLTGDWDFGRCKNSKVDFPWSSCFLVIVYFFWPAAHPPPPPPPPPALFLMVHPLVCWFPHSSIFYFRKTRKLHERPRLNVEVELGSTIQFMCDLPLHFIYLRTYILRT